MADMERRHARHLGRLDVGDMVVADHQAHACIGDAKGAEGVVKDREAGLCGTSQLQG